MAYSRTSSYTLIKLLFAGSSPGAIIGITIAVIAGLVLVAFGLAKYLQIRKRKAGKMMTVQKGKIPLTANLR